MSRRTSRDAILDATLRVLAVSGLSKLALEDVAREADVSRQTLYRHFGSRDALIEATILREESHLFDVMLAAADDATTLEHSLEAAFRDGMAWAREHPLLDRILADEPEALLPYLLTAEGPVLSAARPVVRELIRTHLPEADETQLETDADAVARLIVSFTIAPSDNGDMPATIAALVCRGLGR